MLIGQALVSDVVVRNLVPQKFSAPLGLSPAMYLFKKPLG